MASASSFSTSRSEVASKVKPKNASFKAVTSPSNLAAVGRKLDRIHNCEADLLEQDNQAMAIAVGLAAPVVAVLVAKTPAAKPEPDEKLRDMLPHD
jgi:hypothetical protein